MEFAFNKKKTIRDFVKYTEQGLKSYDVRVEMNHKLHMDNNDIQLFIQLIEKYKDSEETEELNLFVNSIRMELEHYTYQEF